MLGVILTVNAWGQIDTTYQKFRFNCLEGDTLINDPYCWFCQPNDTVIFYGLQVVSPNNRVRYIRHPYDVTVPTPNFIRIFHDLDSTTVIPLLATDFTDKDSALIVDSLMGCPTRPLDTICCIDLIDTFRLQGDTLQISLSDEDSIHFVVLDIPAAGGGDCCCNDCSFAVYREYFSNVTGDSIVVSVNRGRLPPDAGKLWVLREGNKQIEGLDTLGDYTYQDSVIRFGYTLDGEDIEVWFMADTLTNNPVDVQRDYFLNTYGTRVTPTEPLPANPFWVKVFVEGEENHYGNDYQINGAHIDFGYYLDNEDVEVWYISDVDCDLLIFKEWFPGVNGAAVTLTGNQGTLPALQQSILVFVEGWKQQNGSTGDYEISGSSINFKYTLDNEDVEVWHIIGAVDTGISGLFQTD